MDKKRFQVIDDIRGFTMILMIMIHTNAYYLSNKIAYNLLEFSQFAVVAFIFCSSYLSVVRYQEAAKSNQVSVVLKRFWRLLQPYYIFLIPHFILLFWKEPAKLTLRYVLESILLIGGIEFNWLVLLFLQLAVVSPFLLYLFHHKRNLFFVWFAVSLFSSFYFLFHTPLPYFRLIMFLPWSLVVLFTILFGTYQKEVMFWVVSGISSMMLFFVSSKILISMGRSLTHYNNKYPPNIYHLSYGIAAVLILWIISARFKIFSLPVVADLISFMSRNSYQIYFIHIIVIYVVTVVLKIKFMGWVDFFGAVYSLSILVQLVLSMPFQPRRLRGELQNNPSKQ